MIYGYGQETRGEQSSLWDGWRSQEEISRDMRFILGIAGEPIKPRPCLAPRPSCRPWVGKGDGHTALVRCSGCFRCPRCFMEWESTYEQIGMMIISNGYVITKPGDPRRQEP